MSLRKLGLRCAVEVVEFSRKHTAYVHDSLREIRRLVEGLVEKRDQRRDGFVRVIRKAMETKLGEDTDEMMTVLNKNGITRKLTKEAIDVARHVDLDPKTVKAIEKRFLHHYCPAISRTMTTGYGHRIPGICPWGPKAPLK